VNQLIPFLRESSTKAKIALAAGAVATVVVLFLLVRMATAPSYQTLLSGIDPSDTGKVTKALDEQGISYELRNGGTAVAVLPDDTARARIALAEQGLPGKGRPGFELFDKQKMGTSDFQQQVNYQRALEGEIANTIEQVDGVTSAKVQLVMPEDQLFAEDKKPATAAVLLSGNTDGLDAGRVRGIAQLVASSVEGLALDKVTFTDASGALLWPRENGETGDGATAKLAAEQRYNQTLESQLTALVARTVGPDKAQVKVSSTINVDKAKERKLTYGDRRRALKTEREEEELQAEGATGARGAAGTGSNIPNYAGANANGGTSDYRRRKENTDYGVDKTVRDTEFAPGTVERQSVAVLLDASVPAAVAAQIREAVAGAAGIDPARGDTLTVNRVPFAKPEEPEQPSPVEDYLGYAKWGALGLATLIFLLLVRRALRRREEETLGEPVWLSEINAPQPLSALEADAPTLELPRSDIRRRAEELAAKEPEKVAQQLRAWMAEDA
jgi:flagellar M-ring protein FliF